MECVYNWHAAVLQPLCHIGWYSNGRVLIFSMQDFMFMNNEVQTFDYSEDLASLSL